MADNLFRSLLDFIPIPGFKTTFQLAFIVIDFQMILPNRALDGILLTL